MLAEGDLRHVLHSQQVGDLGPALHDRLHQIALGDHDRRVQQPETVPEHLAALVIVQHPGDGTAFDGGQHHQHRVG